MGLYYPTENTPKTKDLMWAHPCVHSDRPSEKLASEKSAFGLRKVGLRPQGALGPSWVVDPDWTWSYLGPRLVVGKLKNKKGPDWAQEGPIWAETWSK